MGRSDIGFDSADNEVTLITADGDRLVPRAPKPVIAAAVLDEIERLLAGPSGSLERRGTDADRAEPWPPGSRAGLVEIGEEGGVAAEAPGRRAGELGRVLARRLVVE